MPFPFVEVPRLRDRPALVVSRALSGGGIDLLWVMMITSAANAGWRDDVSLVERFGECGLAVPCVVRTTKISTVEARRARKAGTLPHDLLLEVQTRTTRHLGL